MREAFAAFRTTHLGGTLKEALVDTVNPTPNELAEFSNNLLNSNFRRQLLQAVANTVGYFLSLIAGIVIMLIGVYFFLVDGLPMVQSLLKLSPLKTDYEKMLIDEFVSISRAVGLYDDIIGARSGNLSWRGF